MVYDKIVKMIDMLFSALPDERLQAILKNGAGAGAFQKYASGRKIRADPCPNRTEGSMDDKTKELAGAPIGRLLLKYSLPAIVGMTITSMYNVIAGIFIGHGVGHQAISGLAVNFPLFNLVMALCMMVAVGGATLCSIELGRKNEERAEQVLGQVVLMNFVLSIVAGLLLYIFIDPILTLFGASDDTRPYARDYIVVLLAASPVGFLMLGLNNIARASGYPAKAMGTALVSVAVNIVLAPLFIFSFHWGMRGAALATVMGQIASCCWLVLHFSRKSSMVRFRPGIFRFQPALCREILAVGLPPFFMNACACLVVIIINQSLKHYGGDLAIGAYGILNRLIMLFGMVVIGLTQGMQPIIGYNFGAGRMDRVHRTLFLGMGTGMIITTAGWRSFQFTPGVLVSMFTDYPELQNLSVSALRACTAVFFIVGWQIVVSAYFQAIGLVSVASFLSLSRQMLFLIPCLLLLPRWLGLNGVWFSLPAADTAATVVTAVILYFVEMRRKR